MENQDHNAELSKSKGVIGVIFLPTSFKNRIPLVQLKGNEAFIESWPQLAEKIHSTHRLIFFSVC